MRKVGSLAVCAVVGLALAAPSSPDPGGGAPAAPRPGAQRLDAPDGLLVLAVLSPERAMVADPRTGATRARRLAGGTLCHGPLLAVGKRVILTALRGRRAVALSLPLTLKGRARPLGAADAKAAHRHERRLELPDGLRPDLRGRAAFSPDGRRVALAIRTRRGTRVGVIDLAGDTWTVLTGPRLVGYRSVAWSPSGRWLYFTGAGHRLYAWRLGSSRPVRLPIRPGGTVMSIATANTPR